MSPNQTRSKAATSPHPADRLPPILDKLRILVANPNATQRDHWQIVDLFQQVADIYGEMAENLPPYNHPIGLDGQEIKTWETA